MALSRSCRRLYSTVVIILLFSPYRSCLLSDYKICGDPECESHMSRVQATKDHHGKDCRFLSFKRGDTIFVYHKLTGRREDLWAGSIDKHFGYFPKDAVKEEQVYATAEKVVPTQKFDFFCLDENGYPIDSSQLETDEDDGNVDENYQGNRNSETHHGGRDAEVEDDGSYSPSPGPSQSNQEGVLFEPSGHTEDSAGTLESMDPRDSSGDGHGPNNQGGSPSSSSSSSSSSWFGSTVTGLLGIQPGSEHADTENIPQEVEHKAKVEEADNSLASSVTQWLGYGGQGEIAETTPGQDEESSTENSGLGYGNERPEDAEKSVKAESEIVEEEEKDSFRKRKLALDIDQLAGEELAAAGTFDWLGDTLSNTIGFGLNRQDSGLEETTDKEEVENTNKDVEPSPSWYDIGIGDVLGFGNNADKSDSTVESGLKEKENDMEKDTELQSTETSPSQNDQDTKEPTNIHNVETSLSPPPPPPSSSPPVPQPPQQQSSENETIRENEVETKTKMPAARINHEEDSVSNTGDFSLEQRQEESKIKTELRDTLPLNGDSAIDNVLDSISMVITDNESEVANLDEVKTLQTKSSQLDHVNEEEEDDDDNDDDDNEKGRETKQADEVSAQTKHGHYPDLTQYSSESENDEGSVETVVDDNQEGETVTGKYNPGGVQINIAGDQISASTQFHDTMQQGQGDNGYGGDGKETVQATDNGLRDTIAAEELHTSHHQALSDSAAKTTEETELNETPTHASPAATPLEQAAELQTGAALGQPSSEEAGMSQEENKGSLSSPDIHAPGLANQYTDMETIDQSPGPPPMSGSAGHSGNDTDSVLLDISQTGAETDDELPLTAAQTVVEEVFDGESVHEGDGENVHEGAEPSVPLFDNDEDPKSTAVENMTGDSGLGTEHLPFRNTANIMEWTQVETQWNEGVKERQQEDTEIAVTMQSGEDTKEDENIAEGEDKESPDGNPPVENHSSSIGEGESKVTATEGLNHNKVSLDEPQREGASDESMVTVKATDVEAAGAGEAESIDDDISHLSANSRDENQETLVVESEMRREYVEEKENHMEGKEEGKHSYIDTLSEEQERDVHHDFMTSKSDESDRSDNSEHLKRPSESELDSDDKVNTLFVSQTGIVKQEEDNVDEMSPVGLRNNIVLNSRENYEQKDLDLDTPGEESSFHDVVPGHTTEFQPENHDQLSLGVATFHEPPTDEMTTSDQQSDVTELRTTIAEEGENINSGNYGTSLTEQSDSIVANIDDDTISASHNGAVFSEQVAFIDSIEPTPTVESGDTVKPERVGGAFGMLTNAFSYLSPTSSAKSQYLQPNPDSGVPEKTAQPEGSLSSKQVPHVIEDRPPGEGVVRDTPASSHTPEPPHQDTSLPLPSAQYQTQSSAESRSQRPTSEVTIKASASTFPKKHKALHGHFSVAETSLLTEVFGRHKLQWLDFILSNPESVGEDVDSDLSILHDMESLLLYHVGKLAQREDNTEQTVELTGLKKLQILLARVKVILNTGQSDVSNRDHEDDISCMGTHCLSREKDEQTAIEGQPGKTKPSSEKTPTLSGEMWQWLDYVQHSTEDACLHILEVWELLRQSIVQVGLAPLLRLYHFKRHMNG